MKDIIGELSAALTGGIISKIHQPDDRNIILRLFSRGGEASLVISAHLRLCRMHLTGQRFVNPPSPPRFCALLRSRIADARIESIEQAGDERIARIRLKKGRDEDAQAFTLVAELTGKSSNIILLDGDGVVIDALRYFGPDTVRPVSPGLRLSPLPPHAVKAEEGRVERLPGESWNEVAERHYAARLMEEAFVAEASALKKSASDALKRLKRKLDNLEGDRKKAEEGLKYYGLGEMLSSNMRLIRRGMETVEVPDYSVYPPRTVNLSIDPALSPRENVEKYFKRAKKAKTALALLEDRIPETSGEVEYLEGVLFSLESAREAAELASVRDELVEAGYLKPRKAAEPGALKGAVAQSSPVRRYTSSDGFDILCGKSGRGNDTIVRDLSSDGDIWMHALGVPGSHVLIKIAGRKTIPERTLTEAAQISAWHSKARAGGKAEVIYTDMKNVRKPRGAKPGMVTVREFKSLLVEPKEPLAEKDKG